MERKIPRRSVVGWVLYDLANTAFSMGVVSFFFSLWVQDHVGEKRADSIYGVITAISMGTIFLFSPILGAMSDHARKRMPFLIISTSICVVLTMLMGRIGFTPTIAAFMIANIAYQAGLQFYDSLLPEVSTEKNRGKIGGIGVGVGYLGSYIPFGLALWFGSGDKALLFLLIAVAFLLFSLPCFFFVHERGNPNPRKIDFDSIRRSLTLTVQTLRSGKDYPGLLRFLIGRIFYTDAINTVISIMGLYTVNNAVAAGLSKVDAEKAASTIFLFAITFAVIGGFAWGWLVDKIGPKKTLNIVLFLWIGIFSFAGIVGIVSLPLFCLYIVAAAAGVGLGGIWSADRPYMLRLTPPDRVGEFYGLYGMVGRFSAITGPGIWAAVTYVTVQRMGLRTTMGQGIAVWVLTGLTILSYFILRKVSDEPRIWKRKVG